MSSNDDLANKTNEKIPKNRRFSNSEFSDNFGRYIELKLCKPSEGEEF